MNRSILLTCLLALLLATHAHAEETRDFSFDARLGYARSLQDGERWHGSALGLALGYHLFDNLRAGVDGEYILLDNYTWRPKAQAFNTSLFLRYSLDDLPVVPALGAGAGLFAEKRKGRPFDTRGAMFILAAIEGRLSPRFGLGAEFTSHITSPKLDVWGFYYTLALRLSTYF